MIFTPPPAIPNPPPVVVVWIHGTKVDECLPSPFARLAKSIGNIIFEHKVGLHHISEFNTHHYDSIRATILGTSQPTLFQTEYIYSFGWSGKLTLQARKDASQELFDALKTISLDIQKKTGLTPKFILISHSHGGNVILHLAEIKDPDGFELTISKAILLACPVQKRTAHLIGSPIFKHIYSLHSHTDMIQIADLQGLHKKKKMSKPLFSQRHFDLHPKLIQAAIKWKQYPEWHQQDRIINEIMLKHLTNGIKLINYLKKNRGLFHIEFQLSPFLRHLASIIAHLDELFENNTQCSSHKDHDVIIEL